MMKRLAGMLMLMASSVVSAGAAPGDVGPVVERDAEIAFWVAGYTGADISGTFNCQAPQLPDMSRTNQEIRSVGKAVRAWQKCHGEFMDKLRAAPAADKRISPAALASMTPAQLEQSRRHVAAIYAELATAANAGAAAVAARHAAWHSATSQFVADQNRAQGAGVAPVARNDTMGRQAQIAERERERSESGRNGL